MEAFFNNILEFFKNFYDKYLIDFFLPYADFLSLEYFGNLFQKYFSGGGFLAGFILVLLIYNASPKEEKIDGCFKVLMVIAVINSCSVITDRLYYLFMGMDPYVGNVLFDVCPDNMVSGFILTLVVLSCYEDYPGRAFLFGVATYMTLALLYGNNFIIDDLSGVFIFLERIILVGVLCVIISKRIYFYTSWIWYFSFHMLFRIEIVVLPPVVNLLQDLSAEQPEVSFEVAPILKNLVVSLSQYKVDYIIFVVVLVFAIVFEKVVLSTGNKAKA